MTRTILVHLNVEVPESCISDDFAINDDETLAQTIGDLVASSAYDRLTECVSDYKVVSVTNALAEEV